MKNISVVTVVYNEEKRIENFIKSFLWSDDLIIVDKQSTDNTPAIARKYNAKVISIPFLEPGIEVQYGFKEVRNEWVLCVTASDVIHPALVKKLLNLVNDPNFDYDVVSIPFTLYVMGIHDPKRSPWFSTSKELLMKKSVTNPSKEIHKECSHSGKRIYKLEYNETESLYHLTHEDFSILLERHIRYTQAEICKYKDEKTALKSAFRDFMAAVNLLVFKKKSFLKGWDGLAISFAYLTYTIFKYLFLWEHFRSKGPGIYKQIREDILNLWEKEKK